MSDKVVAFHRWSRGGPRDDVVVLTNFGRRRFDAYWIGLPRPGLWRVRFNGDWSGYSIAFDDVASHDAWTSPDGLDAMSCSSSFGLGAYSAIILSQDT